MFELLYVMIDKVPVIGYPVGTSSWEVNHVHLESQPTVFPIKTKKITISNDSLLTFTVLCKMYLAVAVLLSKSADFRWV